MKRLILSALFAAALAAPAWAGYAEGRAAYDAGDYTTALLEWRPLAEAGDPAAQYGVGVMYYRGEGVSQEIGEALRLFRLSAAQNYDRAQYTLGVIYENGQGVAQDYAEAMRWYRLAAAQNHPSASLNIGALYYHGRGVTRDYAEAVRWFRVAAAQGSRTAAINIGLMHQSGEGLPRDPVQAYAWYSLAEQRTQSEEPKQQIAALRDAVGGGLDPQQLATAEELARLWASDPAALGQVPATAAAPPATPRELATQVQQLLAKLGYDPGPADGMPGARTRDAIRKFEADRGLPVGGAVSPELLAALRQAQ